MSIEKMEIEQGDVLVVIITSSFVTPVRYRRRVFARIGPRKDIAAPGKEGVTIFLPLKICKTNDRLNRKRSTNSVL